MVLYLNEFEIDNSSESSIKLGAQMLLKYIKPEWKKEELKFKAYNEGISNKLIGVWTQDFNTQLLVRINGEKTELFIDRKAEIENIKFLHENNFGPELFSVFKNGICYAFVPGEIIYPDSVRIEHIWTSVAKHFAKLHKLKISSSDAILFPKIKKFMSLIPDLYSNTQGKRLITAGIDMNYFKNEVQWLKTILKPYTGSVVFCHNDGLLPNIIWNMKLKHVNFIDFEYAGPNYQPFDIANHFCEFVGVTVDLDYEKFYPDVEFQRKWIAIYLSSYQNISPNEISLSELEDFRIWVDKFALASHLFWSTWSLVQAYNSSIDFDFFKYTILRIDEYRKRKANLLSN